MKNKNTPLSEQV